MKNDPKRFEMTFVVELIDGILQKVWWVRARYGHTMPVRCPQHPIHSFLSAYRQHRELTPLLDEYFTSVNWVLYIILLVHRIGNSFVSSCYDVMTSLNVPSHSNHLYY